MKNELCAKQIFHKVVIEKKINPKRQKEKKEKNRKQYANKVIIIGDMFFNRI